MRQIPSPSRRRPRVWVAPLAAFFLLLVAHASARAVPVAGLTTSNKIILFDSDAPGTLLVQTYVIGLQPGERIVGIDYRTSTAQLYAVGSSSRLYTLDPVTGLATQVGSAPFTPALGGVEMGIEFGVDFDPVSGKLRVVSETGQNFLLDPDTGAVAAVGTALVYAAGEPEAGQTPSVTAIAYTRNFKGAGTTTLYGLDWRRNTLVRIGSHTGAPASPSTGQTFTTGPLLTGFGVTELAGFDIAASDANAYAALRSTDALTSSIFYTINLDTGAATQVGTIGGGEFVRDVTTLSRPYDLFAVTASHKLLRFSSATPGLLTDFGVIGPLQSTGERIVALDCCPRGQETLSVLTDASRFYNYNTLTSNNFFVGEILTAKDRLNGTDFGFTFAAANTPSTSPVGGSRVASDSGQNLITNASSGVGGSIRTPLAYAAGDPNAGTAPRVTGIAFDQKAVASTMFDIDSGLDILARQGSKGDSPVSVNSGQLFTIGPLGFDTSGAVGFDTDVGHFLIRGNRTALRDDGAFASLTAPGATASGLYSVSLRTGHATPLGVIGGGEVVSGLTVVPQAGYFRVFQGGTIVKESAGSVTLEVTRTGDTGIEASVDYETFDLNGARQAQDYIFATGTLRFAPGETSKTFKVLITDDVHPEPSGGLGEVFYVRFSNPTNGYEVQFVFPSFSGFPDSTAVFIEDDDSPPPGPQAPSTNEGAVANPVDATTFFVRQHYRDFLGRDPDDAGLAFWTNEIEQCGASPACRELKREQVSAAFFLSIEFQETGFLVQRLYKSAFGRAPSYLEFMRGTSEAGRGIIVGQPGWELRLALAKQAFVARFVASAEFKGAFDAKSNANYVDALFANAGVTPDTSERQALVGGLDNRAETRATILLRVLENAAFKQKEFAPAFVHAEYFGYLRRNADTGGFNFWLGKLQQFDGDFHRAEMVKAFISSIEYRTRFAP